MVVAQMGMSMQFKELQAKVSVRNVEVASIGRLSAQQTCRKLDILDVRVLGMCP